MHLSVCHNYFKLILLFIFCICIKTISAQSLYHSEFQLTSDNDAYMLYGHDGYYTNGLKIAYRWNNRKDFFIKTIHSVEIGQLMYNSKNGSYRYVDELDRPVTAFLYAKYEQENFSINNNVLQWSITLGTIGPAAFGRQVQDAIHSTLHMYTPKEWNFQLKDEVGLNGNIEYSPNVKTNNSISIKPILGATIGNTFTNANAGVAMLIGKFNENSGSMFWNASLNSNTIENFFYIYPRIILKAYDATVQGGLFRKDKGAYIGELNHCVFNPQIGWMLNMKKLLLNFAVNYESKESLTQQDNQWYGTISIGFKF